MGGALASGADRTAVPAVTARRWRPAGAGSLIAPNGAGDPFRAPADRIQDEMMRALGFI